jgi:hypothetical protein
MPTVTGPLRRTQSVHGFETEIARAQALMPARPKK